MNYSARTSSPLRRENAPVPNARYTRYPARFARRVPSSFHTERDQLSVTMLSPVDARSPYGGDGLGATYDACWRSMRSRNAICPSPGTRTSGSAPKGILRAATSTEFVAFELVNRYVPGTN